MINIKPLVMNALVEDSELTAALGGDHIYAKYPETDEPDKLIVYAEAIEPLIKGDERVIVSKVSYDFFIFSDESVSPIVAAVSRVLTDIGGEFQNAPDAPEAYKKAKVLSFAFKVDEDGTIL